MKGIHSLAGFLLLVGIQSSWQVPLQTTQDEFSLLVGEGDLLKEPLELTTVKRHSQGTFTNDYSKYQEMKQAQELVQWLMNSKRNGSSRRHAEGTYTSDVSSFQQEQAAKELVSWLKAATTKEE